MRVTTLFLLFTVLAVCGVSADPADLRGGVFMVHCPPGLQFSTTPPPEGWCQHYIDHYAINACESQMTRIDTHDGVIWYVLAVWEEDKTWSGVEFGLGDFPIGTFGFTAWGSCPPAGVLELPTADWPGQNT